MFVRHVTCVKSAMHTVALGQRALSEILLRWVITKENSKFIKIKLKILLNLNLNIMSVITLKF